MAAEPACLHLMGAIHGSTQHPALPCSRGGCWSLPSILSCMDDSSSTPGLQGLLLAGLGVS